MRRSALGSAQKLERRNGALVAIPHVVAKTGYKASNAYGSRASFTAETTSAFFQSKVLGAARDVSCRGRKSLMPYDPNAPRNRPRESLRSVHGQRFGPACPEQRKRERYRGASSISLADGSIHQPWRTTNQIMRPTAAVVATTGLDNPGISSVIARREHARQR